MAKSNNETVKFSDLVKRAASSSGIAEKEIKNSVAAINSEVETIVRELKPKKVGDSLVIHTGVAVHKFNRLAETVHNGKVYPERINFSSGTPNKLIKLANESMDVRPRAIEEKAPKKKSA